MSSFLDNKIPGEEQNRADQLTGRILVVDLVSLAAHSIEEKEKEMKRLCVYQKKKGRNKNTTTEEEE